MIGRTEPSVKLSADKLNLEMGKLFSGAGANWERLMNMGAIKASQVEVKVLQAVVGAARQCEKLSEKSAAGTRSAENNLRGKMSEFRIDGYVTASGNIEITSAMKGFYNPKTNMHNTGRPALPPGVFEKSRIFVTHSHIPGSHNHHELQDVRYANDYYHGGEHPKISGIAFTADAGRKVEVLVPSTNKTSRAALQSGRYLYSEDKEGLSFTGPFDSPQQ